MPGCSDRSDANNPNGCVLLQHIELPLCQAFDLHDVGCELDKRNLVLPCLASGRFLKNIVKYSTRCERRDKHGCSELPI